MSKEINAPNGQAAGRDIHNHIQAPPCPGPKLCSLHPDNTPESKHQSEFAARTKIWCPPGAREALERLMAKHNFTAPRLHAAWQANSLVWDDERDELVARTYWLEPLFGYGVAGLMVLYFILQGMPLIFNPGPDALRGFFGFVIAVLIYLGMMWLVVRYVIMPYRVAMRAKPILESINVLSSKKSSNSEAL